MRRASWPTRVMWTVWLCILHVWPPTHCCEDNLGPPVAHAWNPVFRDSPCWRPTIGSIVKCSVSIAIERPPLLIFADDWGRHPSSCQHLVKRLRNRHPILWVNTIGTRRVQFNGVTLGRSWEKVKKWWEGLR